MKRIVIFGAGAVGRGLLGKMFTQAGHRVTFVEKNPWLTHQLMSNCYYPLQSSGQLEFIGPVACVPYIQGVIQDELNQADAVFVCVRKENLADVAKNLGGLKQNHQVPVFVVENTPLAGAQLWDLVKDRGSLAFYSAIANTIIPEVPDAIHEIDQALVYGDLGGYLTLPAVARENWLDDIPGVSFVEDFELAWDMKWYLHCSFHLVVGLLGVKYKHENVSDVFAVKSLAGRLFALEMAAANSLVRRYGDDDTVRSTVMTRADSEVELMSEPSVHPDKCKRLIRDLSRKMEPGERLLTLKELVGDDPALDEAIDYAMEIVG